MPQELVVFQSLWAMERRQPDKTEWSFGKKVELIVDAGFDGVSMHFFDPCAVAEKIPLLAERGLLIEGQCFPRTVDDLKPTLELGAKYGCHHIDLQPDVRPRRISDCIPLLEGWRRLADEVEFPVLIETHRNRMTTDLYFVLDLLDYFPDLKIVADLSHFLVGREFSWPIEDESCQQIYRVLDNSWALHGRVASREQIQIGITLPQHRHWVELFLEWWEYGIRSWRKRAGADETLAFTCELGPQPYAISGRDGYDLTDRWQEALFLREAVRDRWRRTAALP